MKHSIWNSQKLHSRLAVSTVIASGLLISIPACKIPCLQKASPGPVMPETFNGRVDADNSACLQFHEFFNDPMLVGLIDQALMDNQELKVLAQDIEIANNEVHARSGAFLPFFSLGAGAGVDKPGRFTRGGAVEDQLQIRPGQDFPEPLPDFLIATNVSWEIDIWKKLRNERNAASLRFLGTNEGRNYIVTRLIAEISENYYELLALDKRLETLDRTIDLQEKSYAAAKASKEAGEGTELAVQRFQAEVRKNQSEKLIIQQEIVETENRINFLCGRYPQPVERQQVDFFDLNLQTLSVGVPSQLLQNRADIRQAERVLEATGLEVAAARARFYPSLTLNAGIGYRAFNTKYLFSTPESLIYNAAGDLVAPLINRRAIEADYLNANAEQLQAVYEYQRTVLNAFTEVINRITKVENYGKSLELKRQQLQSLEASVVSATSLFQNAEAEYVEVLLAQRDLQDAKVVVIETKQQQLSAIVNAYQALGGGMMQGYTPGSYAIPQFSTPPTEFISAGPSMMLPEETKVAPLDLDANGPVEPVKDAKAKAIEDAEAEINAAREQVEAAKAKLDAAKAAAVIDEP